MRQFRLKYFLLSILTGFLVALSFPKLNAFYLTWIAFVPLIYSALRNCVKNSLIYGFLAGFVCNAAALYWIFPFMLYNTDSISQSIIVSVLLWSYLALYFSLWSGFLSFTRRHLYPFLSIIFAACSWIALEFLRTYFLTGFPWNLLGYTQSPFLQIIQIADVLGSYGISFAIICVNMLLYYWLYSKANRRRYLLISALIITVLIGYGLIRMSRFNSSYGEKLNAGIVQPNIDQYKKWNNDYKIEIIKTLEESAKFFEDKERDIIVYPETALPGFLQNNDETDIQNMIKNISNSQNISLIGAPSLTKNKIYNSVFAVSSKEVINIHDKNHLVVFGEYIPFKKLLSKFFGVLNSLGDFSKGSVMQVYSCGKIVVGPTICSENFFPSLSRNLVLNGAKILTNHTNDAWFFDTFAPYQHFVMNIFRAVENRKNIIISANSGLSGIIDSSGNTVLKTQINQSINVSGSVYQNDYITIYTKFGDFFAVMCISVTLFILVIIFII
ncbi:MAG: apolipoprotein N-acyltransferase [Endomicrobiaceae bacterium]|nr:apolipoprotein N-acyltransferase [Endomicrobiaceae bacterium]MDD3730638.1 apolipoprotein N-acyltransferase [Endomicrobiaceae bacterium]MDD4165422.1 apolipoprotein N-acyltransferase [Endomicrobiaceae bacterium]